MKKTLLLLFALQLCQLVFGQKVIDLIIKDINILPMTSDTVIKKKSIAISNGIITEINDFSKIKKSAATKIINGSGKFVLPGLTEMHIHLPETNKLDTFLTTIVAAGITHLRVMYSDESIAAQRKVIESKTIKPKVYYPYLLSRNTVVRTTQQADSLFGEIKKDHYDFVKLYSMQVRKDFNDTVFDMIMNSANQHQMTVCGHYPSKIRLSKVISSGFKSIEHLAGYMDIPEDKMDLALELTKKHKTYNCPTLDWDVMGYDLPFPNDYNSRLIAYNAPKNYMDRWNKDLEAMIKRNGSEKIAKDKAEYLPTFNKKMMLLKRLNDSGNLLIVGGESGNLFQLEGFNMYEEMMHWSKAGITNFDILRAAIVNPAMFFNEEALRGTIEIGKEASLIILEKDPLLDISNIKTIETTIIKGKVFNKKELLSKI